MGNPLMGSPFEIFRPGEVASHTHFAGALASWGVGAKSDQALALFEASLAAAGEARKLEALLEGYRRATDTTVRKEYFWQAIAWIRSHPYQIKRALEAMRRRYVAGTNRFDDTTRLAVSLRLILAQSSPEVSLGAGGPSPVSRPRYSLAGTTGDIVDSDASGDGVKEFTRPAKDLRKARRFQEAIDLLNEGLRQFPNNVRLLCSMAEVYGRMRENDKALEWFRLAVAQDPDNEATLTALGQLYFRMGRLEESLITLQRAVEIDPKSISAHQALGQTYLSLSNDRAAAASFRKAHALQLENGEQPTAELRRGEATVTRKLASDLRGQGRYEEEIEVLQRLVEESPQDGTLLCKLGEAYRKVGKYNQALDCFQRAFAVEPQNEVILTLIGRTYLLMGKEEEALKAFQQAHALNARDGVVLSEMGGVYLRRGEYRKALDAYQQAVALNPDDVIALTALGKTYKMMGDLDQALATYQRGLMFRQRDVILLTAIGKIYLMKRLPDQALVFFERGLAGNPDDGILHTGVGEAYLMMGRIEKALAALLKAIRLRPDYRLAHHLLEQVRRRQR